MDGAYKEMNGWEGVGVVGAGGQAEGVPSCH